MATGFKELVLVPALRKKGLMEKGLADWEARAVIAAVFGSIKDALGRHERVELPIGTFTVVQNKEIELGKYQIDFLPSPPRPPRKKKLTKIEPTEPAKTEPTRGEPTTTEPTKTEPAKTELTESEPTKSELTTAAELIVDFIRENVQQCNWNLFFDANHQSPEL